MRALPLRLARTRPGGAVLRLLLARFPGLLPFQKRYRSKTIIAFDHPRPSYPVHILVLPLPAYRSLADLPAEEEALYADVVRAAWLIARDLQLPAGWRLVVNAGAFQDVPLLHFHLIY